MAVVDVSTVTDGFDAEKVLTAVPRDDGAIISRPELVVRIAREWFQAMLGLVRRLVYLVHHAVGDLRIEISQVVDGLLSVLKSVIQTQPLACLFGSHCLAFFCLFPTLFQIFKRVLGEGRRRVDPVPECVPDSFGFAGVAAPLPLFVDPRQQRFGDPDVDLLHPVFA